MTGFPAGAFAANCYLVAPAPGEECVIIDPGQDAERGIEELLDRYRLKPIAVLLTHGHVDHIWSVAPVCGAKGVPAYVHPDDRALLADPGRGLDLMAKQQFLGGMTFSEPDDVRALEDGEVVPLAGLDFTIGHTPGHTPGSVTFRSGDDDDLDALFTGDLLFAGLHRPHRPARRRPRDHTEVAGPHAHPARRDGRAARSRADDDDRRRAQGQPVP